MDNRWEFEIETGLFDGWGPTPGPEVITISPLIVDNINSFITECVNAIFKDKGDVYDDCFGENGTQGLELLINHVLDRQHEINGSPRIRTEFYPCERGLQVVVNVIIDKDQNLIGTNLLPPAETALREK